MPDPNPAQLKGAIDSGRTRDKVAAPDPAMSPLGTDSEAGGTPPTVGETKQALRHEVGRTPPRRVTPVWPIIIGATVVSLIAGVALALLGTPY